MVPPKRRNQPRSSTGQSSARPDNHPSERASPRHDPALTAPNPPTSVSAAAAPSVATLAYRYDFEPGSDPNLNLDPNQGFVPAFAEDFSHQLSAYLPSPGGPLLADGDTAVDFSRFGTFYEPQGELAPRVDQVAAEPGPGRAGHVRRVRDGVP
jgi:hypothetical protein